MADEQKEATLTGVGDEEVEGSFNCNDCEQTYQTEDDEREDFSDAYMLRGGGAICQECHDDVNGGYTSCDSCGYYAPFRKLESFGDKLYHGECLPRARRAA